MKTNQEMIESLKALCSIDSVAYVNVTEECPYGTGPAKALKEALGISKNLGLRVTDRDGKIAWAEIGEGEEMVGILGHLDVVPAGEGWDYPAYDLTETDNGRMYGRGVQDDKGPLVACLYAMNDILESGIALKRRVRVIFGQCEEVGDWPDMQWYRSHEELPVFGFTPDADFPAIYGEKSIYTLKLKMPADKTVISAIQGGDASNMVAAGCKATVEGVEYETQGKAAHGSTPQDGVNAISKMFELLSEKYADDPLIEFYQKYIGSAVNGEKMGCAFEDEKSGKLTMNVGTIQIADGYVEMMVDNRIPVDFTPEQLLKIFEEKTAPYGIQVEPSKVSPSVYMDKNGPVLQSLLKVYRDTTGDMSEPFVIGGGTYAKAMKNIVAFGPILPGREVTEHQKNEYILKEDFFQLREIYRKSIEALVNL